MARFTGAMPESRIRGVDILILVCVGASEYGFDRLLKYVDELCESGVIEGQDVVAQVGCAKYKPKYYRFFDLIGRAEFQNYMEKADVIITHAGTGSVIPPLKIGKKVIVFPRRVQYGEHVDDHQMELAEVFTSAGYTLCAENKEELQKALIEVQNFTPKVFKSNKGNIDRILIDFIEST